MKEKIASHEHHNILQILSMFFFGTFSFIILVFLGMNDLFRLPKLIFLLVFVFLYELVLAKFIVYYSILGKRTVSEHYQKNKNIYKKLFLALILLSYSVIGYFQNKWIGFANNLVYGAIILIGVPLVTSFISKISKKKK